jgi:DNA-binding response OmpR family regulator
MRVLIADPDPATRESLVGLLEHRGVDCDVSVTLDQALRRAERTSYDMVITELLGGRPDCVSELARASKSDIVVLTSLRDRKIHLLAELAGAALVDVKPADPLFLHRLEKAKAGTFLCEPKQAGPLRWDGLELQLGGAPLVLSRTERGILLTLLSASPVAVTRDRLVERAWGRPDVSDYAIENRVSSLRRKLSPWGTLIVPVVGLGYRLVPDAGPAKKGASRRTGRPEPGTEPEPAKKARKRANCPK